MKQNIDKQTQSPDKNKATRTVFIGAKVTPGQKEYIKSQAGLCGMTVSDYLLACAYNYQPKPRLTKEETDLLQNLDNCRWLKELGNIAESVCQFLNAVKERNKIPANDKSEKV